MPKVDRAKRARIMRRSQKLGHCVCEPRRPCPCDVFTERGLCPCAGERPDPLPAGQVKLTELVRNPGCASKIAARDLEAVLSRLPAVDDPAILSGIPAGDDAAVYAISDGVKLVQTLDVFTPCVDDPYLFGRICAANCLSDIYAMGSVPRTALSIMAFPTEKLDGRIMREMITGAMAVFAEAGVALIGGHSIKDEEIKLGFAITGTTRAGQAVADDSAQVGDLLVLTKPLGVGVLNFGRQIGRAHNEGLAEAEKSMATLNRPAAEAMMEVGVSACTDVTGFGLFGHLISMARHSGVTAEVHAGSLPAFPGVLPALREGAIPGAGEHNRQFVGEDITVAEGVDDSLVELGFDAQTSGGLLIAVAGGKHQTLLRALADRGAEGVTIGKIVAASDGHITVTQGGQPAPALAKTSKEIKEMPQDSPADESSHSPECCADAFGETPAATASASSATAAADAFAQFMGATSAAGAIDAPTKELINLALVVLARCRPCIRFHLKQARKMGITQEQIDEAAWCAVGIGGAPVRMFYSETLADAPPSGDSSCRE